jgi:light-harvesting complex I chlorophyll a/b binding protein 1
VGFLVTEAPFNFHPLFNAGGRDIGPAIRHLDEVRAVSPTFFTVLAVAIGGFEILRATKGWEVLGLENLKEDYYPGDIGFDPLGLKPTDPAAFEKMATKELNNGRLAMIAAAGFLAQELASGTGIFVNLGLAADNFDPSTLPVVF